MNELNGMSGLPPQQTPLIRASNQTAFSVFVQEGSLWLRKKKKKKRFEACLGEREMEEEMPFFMGSIKEQDEREKKKKCNLEPE